MELTLKPHIEKSRLSFHGGPARLRIRTREACRSLLTLSWHSFTTFSLQSACAILLHSACHFKPDDRLNQHTGWGWWWHTYAGLTTSVCQRGNDVNYDTHICSQNATQCHGGVTPDVEPSSLLKPEPTGRFRLLDSKMRENEIACCRPLYEKVLTLCLLHMWWSFPLAPGGGRKSPRIEYGA